MISKEELTAELQRLAPFHHNIELPYGLSTFLPDRSRREVERTRVSTLVRHAFPTLLEACGGSLAGKRVLDVACSCGGFSFEAAKLGADHVLGFDVVDRYLEQANLVKRALEADRVEFRELDLEAIDPDDVGEFDVTFCFGILYHLENPVLAMKKLAAVTRDIMLVDTSVVPDRILDRNRSRPVWIMNFPSVADDAHKSATTSLWRTERFAQFRPNIAAVIELLRFLGFSRVEVIRPTEKGLEKRFYKGRRVSFLARR